MKFETQQFLEDGSILKHVIIYGMSPDSRDIEAVEGTMLKRKQDNDFKLCLTLVHQYLNENRFNEIQVLRAKNMEPFVFAKDINKQERKIFHLPFTTVLRLRYENWIKVESYHQHVVIRESS